jgi:hypothetical protein
VVSLHAHASQHLGGVHRQCVKVVWKL